MLSLVERPPKVMAAGIMSNHITPSRNLTKKNYPAKNAKKTTIQIYKQTLRKHQQSPEN